MLLPKIQSQLLGRFVVLDSPKAGLCHRNYSDSQTVAAPEIASADGLIPLDGFWPS